MIDAYVRDAARWTPRAPALVLPDRRVTYAEFDADIDRLAGKLASEGATSEAGAAAVVAAVVANDPYLRHVANLALSRLGLAAALHGAPGASRAAPPLDTAPAPPQPTLLPDPEGLAAVLPAADGRGVGVTWRRLERIVYTVLRAACPGRQGAWIAAGDLPPMAAFSLAAAGWAAGAAVTEGFAVEAIPALVETLAPGVVWTTPAALAQLLRGLPAGFRARPDWRVLCCGEGLDPDVARQARLDLTPDVHLLYGPAEAAVTAIGPAADLDILPGLAGVVPSDTEVTIMGSDGEPVAPGEVGELLIAGPRVAGGYVDDAAATVERFPGGRFRTGQPARHLADGRLILEGRA